MPPRVLLNALDYLARGLADSTDVMLNLLALPVLFTLRHIQRYRTLAFGPTVDTLIVQAQVLGKVGRMSDASEVLRDIISGHSKLGPLLHESTHVEKEQSDRESVVSDAKVSKEKGKAKTKDSPGDPPTSEEVHSNETQVLALLDDTCRFWEGSNPVALSWLVKLGFHTIDPRVNVALKPCARIRLALQRLTLAIEVLEVGGCNRDEASKKVRQMIATACVNWTSALWSIAQPVVVIASDRREGEASEPVVPTKGKSGSGGKAAADTGGVGESSEESVEAERMAFWRNLGCVDGHVDAWLISYASQLRARALVQLGDNDEAMNVVLLSLEGPTTLASTAEETTVSQPQADGEPALLQNRETIASKPTGRLLCAICGDHALVSVYMLLLLPSRVHMTYIRHSLLM
jgi:hypothetical protein